MLLVVKEVKSHRSHKGLLVPGSTNAGGRLSGDFWKLGIKCECSEHNAQSAARSRVSPDGVPALPACHCVVAGSDRAQRSTDYLSDHGLQQLVKRFLCCLGKLSPDGARLKQRLFNSLHGMVLEHLSCSTRRALPSPSRNRRL